MREKSFTINCLQVSRNGGAPESTGNAQLAETLSLWCFNERGLLRLDSVNHHHVGQKSPPEFYTIRDHVEKLLVDLSPQVHKKSYFS